MKPRFFTLFTLVCLGVTLSKAANAAIYQCEKNGIVEFSQQPCGKDAKLITVKEQNPTLLGSPKPVSESSDVTAEIDNYIRLKQIDAKIAEHNNKIDSYSERMNNEIAALSSQADAQLHNLVGAKKEAAIAKQMSAVSERYNLLINNEQRNIDRLSTEKSQLVLQSNETEKNEIDHFIRSEQIKREIAEHKDKIDRYHVELNQQIKRLEQQASTRPTNLVDASSDQALSDKMSAVTSKFNTLIAVEQRQIDRLNNELTQH